MELYLNNTKLLDEMVKKGELGNEKIAEDMKDMRVEEDRVHYLKEVFNHSISMFETVKLWEGEAPETHREYELQNQPQIAIFPGKGEAKSRGIVIVAPGGGYNVKSITFEGFPIIHKLNENGISAALLDYRLKPYPVNISLMDMQRAIRYIRSRAKELQIDDKLIAVHGSSAGGNLSALAAVHYDLGDKNSSDPVERYSCRPNAAILSYGAFSAASAQHEDLRSPLSDRDIAQKYFSSPDKHVTPDTPPFFMWQTSDQDDPRSACIMIKALAECGVRCEAHIFPYGPHGTGMADGRNPLRFNDSHVAHWADLAIEWLRIYGF